jgi:hypothetical protein
MYMRIDLIRGPSSLRATSLRHVVVLASGFRHIWSYNLIQLKTAGTSSTQHPVMCICTRRRPWPWLLSSVAHAHGGHKNLETLVTYLDTVQGYAAW